MSAAPAHTTLLYDLWLAGWESELSALAAATVSRALSENQVTAHTAVINAEREVVTKLLTPLLGDELHRPGRPRRP